MEPTQTAFCIPGLILKGVLFIVLVFLLIFCFCFLQDFESHLHKHLSSRSLHLLIYSLYQPLFGISDVLRISGLSASAFLGRYNTF